MPRNNKPKRRGQHAKPWTTQTARTSTTGRSRDRKRRRQPSNYRLSVRGELRDTPDVGRIARVVVALAQAQAEADAAAEAKAKAEAERQPHADTPPSGTAETADD